MLPSCYRLPAPNIPLVMRRGKRIIDELFQIIVQKNEEDVNRFAYIISTKIDKRATRRNRMKRLISESIYHLLPRLCGHNDYIFVARKDFSETLQQDVEVTLSTILEKAELLR
jgi:ribonuclease P protein component